MMIRARGVVPSSGCMNRCLDFPVLVCGRRGKGGKVN